MHGIDVGEDLTPVGLKSCRERDGGRFGSATAERRDLLLDADALESTNDHDVALLEFADDAVWSDLEDAGIGVPGVRDDANLASRE